MPIKKKTLKYFKKFPSGGSIRVTANDPNNDADLESYQITTKNGNGSEQTIRMHELEGITVKSLNGSVEVIAGRGSIRITPDGYVLAKCINSNDNGETLIKTIGDTIEISHIKPGINSKIAIGINGEITLNTDQDSNSFQTEIRLDQGKLRIVLADQNIGGTILELDANSLQTLKTLLGL